MPFTSGSTPFGIFDTDVDFVADADRILEYVRRKLGDPIMQVELSSSQVYAAFEEACLEYSAIVNQYQAKSVLATFLGSPTGSLAGGEQTYPDKLIEFQKKMADPYGEESGVGGTHTLYSASIDLETGTQKYNLQALLSGAAGIPTGSDGLPQRLHVKEIFHFSPLSAYRFFGTTSALNYLHNQFGFESFTPETIFYLLPIWEDVLRGMEFKMSNKIRRSNYSYSMHNNELTLFPVPTQNIKLFFTYMIAPNPLQSDAAGDSTLGGVANLSNIPFGNITYSKLNSMGKQWIRRFTFALAKEVLGHIRGKMSNIPIPNGDLTLDGPELISDGRADQDALREELKGILDETTYQKLAAQEAQFAADINEAIKNVPLGIYIG